MDTLRKLCVYHAEQAKAFHRGDDHAESHFKKWEAVADAMKTIHKLETTP